MKVIIVGGGITGISAALRLKRDGIESIILDKGKAPGGRTATRRVSLPDGQEAVFDYGAPHFKVKSELWEEMVIFLASHFVVKISKPQSVTVNETTYRGSKSMRGISAFLSSKLSYLNDKKVLMINPQNNSTEVITEDGSTYEGDAIILTPPLPQTLELFNNSKINLPAKLKNNLSKISYTKTIMALLAIEGESHIVNGGYQDIDFDGIKYVIDNKKRGISDVTALTIAASENFSENHFDIPNTELQKILLEKAENFYSGKVIAAQIHKWKYSQPTKVYKKSYEYITAPAPFVLAGDAFCKGNVEGAFMSGVDAAEYLIWKLNN